jgi:DNA-damage-inducible protein D
MGMHSVKVDLRNTDVFHFEEKYMNFNDIAREDEFTYWYAREYMNMLGYKSYDSFRNAINKAVGICVTLDIFVEENFKKVEREIDGRQKSDYKLSRFACYLVAMNGDTKKKEVAAAQAFFAVTAEAIRRYVEDSEDVERVSVRKDVSVYQKELGSTAKNAGVTDYALFQNSGYRGMYNMNLNDLKEYKGFTKKGRTLLDFMGKSELAANLFRITQTDLKMKTESVKGQINAEIAAETVGKKVRETIIDISGMEPENMELVEDIKKVKTSLKITHKGLKKIDE